MVLDLHYLLLFLLYDSNQPGLYQTRLNNFLLPTLEQEQTKNHTIVSMSSSCSPLVYFKIRFNNESLVFKGLIKTDATSVYSVYCFTSMLGLSSNSFL